MRYLIVGGAGFIGTNLVKFLQNQPDPCNITVFDNFLTVENKKKRIEELYSLGDIRVVQGDVANLRDWEFAGSFDVLINLACPASPIKYKQYPEDVFEACSKGTWNCVRYAKAASAYLIHASSSEIYGAAKFMYESQIDASLSTKSTRAIYAEGKRFSEAICNTFKGPEQKIGIIRIFNTYGPYMDLNDGRVMSALFKAMLEKTDFPMENSQARRSFMYIDDLIRAIHFLIANQADGTYNVGNPHSNYSIGTLFDIFKKKWPEYKLNADINPNLKRDFEILDRVPSIEKIKKEFGWEPLINLTTGITRTYEWLTSER